MDIMELLATRRTYRRFQQTPVPAAVVDDMIQAVRLSSCGGNRQAIRLVVVQSPEMVARVQPLVKWAAYLPPSRDAGPRRTARPVRGRGPGCLDPRRQGHRRRHRPDQPDPGRLGQGVGSCIMGAIDRPRLTGLLGLAENETLHTMVALGYPAHAARVVP